MTDDHADAALLAAQRDWLLGRNPWGTAMLTFLPDAPSPRHPHLSTVQLTGRPVLGGLVDGPVAARVFASLKGVTLSGPDPLAAYQGEAVYHDDALDYSTNEPTLDGTASAVLLFALIG
jgi:endoglucanase